MSCGAEPGSSGGASGGPDDEKDKDMDSSHQVNELEDMEYPEAGTLTHSSAEADDLSHSAAYTSSQEDTYKEWKGNNLTLRVRWQPQPPRPAPGGPRRVKGEGRTQLITFPIPI